jgi:predicted phosphodiesterase
MNKKRILYYLILLIFFPVFLYSQDFKIEHGPYLQAVGENEVTLVWTTNKDAVSWVEIAPAGDDSFYSEARPAVYQTQFGNRTVGYLHKVRIRNLTSNTEYRYRVFSKEIQTYEGKRVIYGKIAATDVFRKKPLRFKTLGRTQDKVHFSMVCDVHGHIDTLKALLQNVKYRETDLVFFNGDMVSTVESEKQFFEGFMQPAIDMFASEVPMFYVRGNHETRGKFSMDFPQYFPTTTGNLYYSFRQGSVFFIVLDGGEDKPDSDIEYSDLAQFDNYRTEQAQWLEKTVQSEDCKNAEYRIVINHIPPFGTDWHGAQDIKKKFLPILNNANISVMLCGHIHIYEYIEPKAGEHNFPIYINAANSVLDIDVNSQEIVINRKNTKGRILDTNKLKQQ